MKNISSLAISIAISIACTAQPTLQQTNGFQANTSIQFYVQIDPEQDEGHGGINQTWDFSSLASSDGSTEFNGVLASGTPYSSDFPGAQVASTNYDYSGNMIYNYFTNDATLYTTWGYESDQQKLVYSNPRDILHYPFTYGDSFYDSYYGTLPTGYNAGSIEEKADGYGNLVLPTGTFHNCLRVREVRKDTLGNLTVVTSNDTSYKFYAVNYPEPLCQVNYHHSSDGFNIKEIYWQDVQTSGLAELNELMPLSTFPNPCADVLNVSLPDDEQNATIKITDALGRVIEAEHHFQNDALILNTSLLPQGIYFLSVEASKVKVRCLFVKEMK